MFVHEVAHEWPTCGHVVDDMLQGPVVAQQRVLQLKGPNSHASELEGVCIGLAIQTNVIHGCQQEDVRQVHATNL